MCSGRHISPWPTQRLSQSYSCISGPLMFFFHGVIFAVQVLSRHHTVGRLSWVEVNPFLPLHAGTQTISWTPQQHTNMCQKSTSARSPSSPHPLSRWRAVAVLQGYHIRGRAISHDAVIILHSKQRNWYLYHNITTMLLWKKHNISTKMIPFGACHLFPVNHHNILVCRRYTIRNSSLTG